MTGRLGIVRRDGARAAVARRSSRASLICAGAACLLAALSWTEPASAEGRSFVVAWFTAAAYAQDGDCPDGLNPSIDGIYRNALNNLGVSPDEVERLYKKYVGTTGGEEAAQIVVNRGRVDGKPVNAYANPTSVPDPHLHTVQGRYAFGFNLDGKGAASPNGFEDPETHEKGVNNEYWRAMGCNKSFRAVPPQRPVQGGEYQWDTIRSTTPAWLITISGDDLDKDGEVTVTVERALEHVSLDAKSETAADMTYRIDPDPRWHNQFRGRTENGLITATMPADFHLESDPYFVQEFVFHQPHLRLRIKPDGNLEGIIGGYQPWLPIYYSYGDTSIALECCAALDFVGVYYTLRRLADAYPDPKTGHNTAISAAYHIDAVPAFVVPANQAADGARLSSAH